MLGGYKCGWWKVVRDNDEKSCKISNEFKNSFFLFFFCKSGEMNQFFFSFPRTTHCDWKEKNLKTVFFLKIKKFVIFKIEKKWKLIAYYDSAYPT